MSNWTQACCDDCWVEKNPGRIPTRVKDAEQETCCFCGSNTVGGIFIRINPNDIPYPRKSE